MAKPAFKTPDVFYPPVLCAVYSLAALFALMAFRFFFPGGFFSREAEETFLPIYRFGRIAARALLDWIALFPALIMAALVMPFGLKPDYAPAVKRFSLSFLNRLKPAIFTALCSAGLFAVFTLILRPTLYNYQENMKTNSRIYWQSKENAAIYADNEDWVMAAGFLAVCKKIWPEKNEQLSPLEQRIRTGQERLLYGRPAARTAPVSERGLPGQKQPVNAQEAVALATKAMDEGRLYDAHWLANLATRLARPGSAESSAGARLASWAWNSIAGIAPGADERRLAAIYRQKREAYESMLSEDWIRAYYLFNELSLIVPGDPDVRAFLEMSRDGVKEAAFFIDEIDGIVGGEVENAVFSLPALAFEGRLVIRAAYLSALADASFISRLEVAAFGADNAMLFRVEAPFAKCVPLFVNGGWKSLLLLRALDRADDRLRWEPAWTGDVPSETGAYSLLLDIRYEDFLLAAAGGRDLKGFYLADFWRAAAALEPYGFAPEVFQAEIIRALNEPLLFLPLALYAIILGWRLRSRNRPRFSGIPMAFLLPVVFNALFTLVLGVLMNGYLVLLLSAGWLAALVVAALLALALLAFSLLALAAEHG